MRTIQSVLASEQAARPSKPTELTARATSSKQIELTWTSSPDLESVIVYLIERREPGATKDKFAQIAIVTTPSYSDSAKQGLFPGTTYQYRIRAVNVAGALSPYSRKVSAKTYRRQEFKEFESKVKASLEGSPKDIEWTALSSLDGGATWQQETLPTFRDRNKIYDIRPSPYVDALCLKKATEAAQYASKLGLGTSLFGRDGFAAIGYEAARYALLRFDPSKGKLEKILFSDAFEAIKETAKDEANSWGGKKPHKKGIQTPKVFNFSSGPEAKQDMEGNVSKTLGDVITGTLSAESGDWVERADADIDAIRILGSLPSEDRELLTLHLEGWTNAALAEMFWISEDTAERRVKRLIKKLQDEHVF